jgi:probable HAF family extracellular repeat protein
MGKIRFVSATVAIAMLACTSEPGPTDVSEAPSLVETIAHTYTAMNLGHLGGDRSYALAINAVGQVVGGSALPNGETRAFLWENGVMKDLGTLGGDYSEAFGINDHGHVVGVSRTSTGVNHAFLWKDGAITDLGTVGKRESGALDINNGGQIAGGADGLAIIWKDGVLTKLKRPVDATHCAVAEINDAGLAVGQCTVGNTARAILWNGNTVKDLGTLGGDLASPAGINRWGVVVGSSWVTFGNGIHPFLWQDGKMIDLATRGAHQGFAPTAINDRRQVVGNFGGGDQIHAAVWQKGMMTDISVPGTDSYVFDINKSGQAVGQTVSGNDVRAVLWTHE